ncbi:MAG: SDR family NAD(P)-dependent oxidoreductase [bacterium]|nr:SDR family NAD(P)-dependent oxidoreductase [bacterium]
MDSLQDRIALVTGGSRGIGRACAAALAGEGTQVIVNYRSRGKEAEESCRLIAAAGGRAFSLQADVSKAAEVDAMMAEIRSRAGEVAILVNNAGIAIKCAPDQLTEAVWDEVIEVNLKSAFLCTMAVMPGMRKAGWGRIINISSGAAFTGGRVGPHYAASKAGMHGMMRGFAAFLAAEGVTVNAVVPSLIQTDMLANDLGLRISPVPIGRFGRPEEVADVVAMVARGGYITGQALVINGGTYMK